MATMHEGRASLTTAIINSLGYGIMMFSAYKPTAWFGGLLALTMVVAFLAEVFVVPAVITLMPRIFGARGSAATRASGVTGANGSLVAARSWLVARRSARAVRASGDAQVDGHVSVLVDVLPDPDARPGRQAVDGRCVPGCSPSGATSSAAHLRLVLSGLRGRPARRGTGAGVRNGARRHRPSAGPVRRDDVAARRCARRRLADRLGPARRVPADRCRQSDRPVAGSCSRGAARRGCRWAWCAGGSSCRGVATLDVIAVPGISRRPLRPAGRADVAVQPQRRAARRFVERREPAFGTRKPAGWRPAHRDDRPGRLGRDRLPRTRPFPTLTTPSPRPPVRYEDVSALHDGGRRFRDRARCVGRPGRGRLLRGRRAAVGAAAARRRGRSIGGRRRRGSPAGSYRLAGNVLCRRRRDVPTRRGGGRTDVTLVAAADRSFARETRTLRLFAVHDPDRRHDVRARDRRHEPARQRVAGGLRRAAHRNVHRPPSAG